MCTGKTTHLVCGHALVHFKTRCERECHFPIGPIAHIKDTCASCDPEYRINCLNQEYHQPMVNLKSQHSSALREGRNSDAAKLERQLNETNWELTKLIAAARRTGWNCDGEVIWPGKREGW